MNNRTSFAFKFVSLSGIVDSPPDAVDVVADDKTRTVASSASFSIFKFL
jgi:hypothetical protein